MPIEPYRRLFALPGVRPLVVVTLLARTPIAAGPMVLNLHVLQDLGQSYTWAAVVSVAVTIGLAVGSPLLGRMVDSVGLRPVILMTTVVEGVFWFASPWLGLTGLLATAVFGGLFALPVHSISRQAMAALVPEAQRRTAFSLDSMVVEAAFMVGPALGVVVVTGLSGQVAMIGVGSCIVLAGIGLFLLNPATRSSTSEVATGPRPPRSSWLTTRMLAVLAASTGAVLVLSGSDLAIVGVLREAGQLPWTSAVIPIWCLASLIGGFVYGAMHRSYPSLVLMGLLGLCTIPVAFADQWWLLGLMLIPAGLLCAPTIAATSEEVSRLTPESVRGEALGLHGSALTAGSALGAPLAGLAIDLAGPPWGFVAVGGAGLLSAIVAWTLFRASANRAAAKAETAI
ncbi:MULTISPECIES: MFS transporter [unclassified Crossiella]|uniref:MFS transporter n=1 Tax=unclassified Crossiella TaxID=2620835 RepID=UPI001FFE6704|nr:MULTISPECIES: MFS transporter [unclassified Crossiella]MCK2237623.1 MFS transporter [Crossiella sp. S99.2]MCK2254909.1 MFS transporter [Crossiella sp. S99.1]